MTYHCLLSELLDSLDGTRRPFLKCHAMNLDFQVSLPSDANVNLTLGGLHKTD